MAPVIVHLNGQLVPRESARVSVFDRGFLFGDGLYEGLRAFEGRVVRADLHTERLSNGLNEVGIAFDAASLEPATHELLEASGLRNAFIYWQVTRGEPAPDQPVRSRVPAAEQKPTVFGYCVPAPGLDSYDDPPTKSAMTIPDLRWHRGHVKSISLVGNVMAALDAHTFGSDDAIFVRDGLAAEGTSANLAVVRHGPGGAVTIATPSLTSVSILAGVTRAILLEEMPEIEVRPVLEDELVTADEIVLLGTLTMVTSVTSLNGVQVGAGMPGPGARRMLRVLIDAIRSEWEAAARAGEATGARR